MSRNVNLILEILILIFFCFNFGLSDKLKNFEEIVVYPTIQDNQNHPSHFNDYHNYYSDYSSILTNPRYHRSRYVPDIDKTAIFKFYKPERTVVEDNNYYKRLRKDLYERRSLNDDLNKNGKRRVVVGDGENFFEDTEEYPDEIIARKLNYGIKNRPSVIENFYKNEDDYVNENPELIYNYPIRNSDNFPISVQLRSYLSNNKKRGLKSFTDEELEEIVNRALELAEKRILLINDKENKKVKGNSLIREKFFSDYGNDRFNVAELNDPDASSQLLLNEKEIKKPISIEEIDTKAIIAAAAAGGSEEDDQASTIMMDDDVVLLNEGEEVPEESAASSSDSDNPTDSDGTIVDNNSTIEREGKEEEEEEIVTGEVQKSISGEEKMIDERLAEPEIAVIDEEE